MVTYRYDGMCPPWGQRPPLENFFGQKTLPRHSGVRWYIVLLNNVHTKRVIREHKNFFWKKSLIGPKEGEKHKKAHGEPLNEKIQKNATPQPRRNGNQDRHTKS